MPGKGLLLPSPGAALPTSGGILIGVPNKILDAQLNVNFKQWTIRDNEGHIYTKIFVYPKLGFNWTSEFYLRALTPRAPSVPVALMPHPPLVLPASRALSGQNPAPFPSWPAHSAMGRRARGLSRWPARHVSCRVSGAANHWIGLERGLPVLAGAWPLMPGKTGWLTGSVMPCGPLFSLPSSALGRPHHDFCPQVGFTPTLALPGRGLPPHFPVSSLGAGEVPPAFPDFVDSPRNVNGVWH